MITKPATKPTKAVGTLILTFATALYATVQGRTDLDTMTWKDWGIVLVGTAVATGTVYFAPNRPTGT